MELIAIVPTRSVVRRPQILDIFQDRGCTVREIRSGVRLTLPHDEHGVFQLPQGVRNSYLRMQVTEYGGRRGKRTGEAQVVCSISGKALTPFYVPHRGFKPCGVHARFSINHEFVVARATVQGAIELWAHGIVWSGNQRVRITHDSIWEGLAEDLPMDCWQYARAVAAALAKARCRGCVHPHFIKDPRPEGGNGNGHPHR